MACATVKSRFYDVTANLNQLNSAVDWNQFSVVWRVTGAGIGIF